MKKYEKKSCHRTRKAAKKEQKIMKDKGLTAQIKKSGKNFCIYSKGKRK